MSKNGQKYILVTLVLICVSGIFFLYKITQTRSISLNQYFTLSSPIPSSSSSSPLPFIDLTIPFLRERKYQSALASLEKITQNPNYTSYLTSFTSDGLRINGLLTIPIGQKPVAGWSAIVFVHGYIPPKQYVTQEKYQDYVDFLARNGFVVFKIDLRGHGSSEGEASGAYYSSDYVIDTLNAREALKTLRLPDSGVIPKIIETQNEVGIPQNYKVLVDPNKIGLWGHSMAGNVVFRSLAARPEIPAVVIWAGAGYTYSDLREYRIGDVSYQSPPAGSERARQRKILFETYGEFDPENIFWMQVIPTNYLTDIKGAIQIHHATNDEVVSIEYSRNLKKILDATSIIHELYEYPNGGHNLTGSSFTQAMQRTVEFYNKYFR